MRFFKKIQDVRRLHVYLKYSDRHGRSAPINWLDYDSLQQVLTCKTKQSNIEWSSWHLPLQFTGGRACFSLSRPGGGGGLAYKNETELNLKCKIWGIFEPKEIVSLIVNLLFKIVDRSENAYESRSPFQISNKRLLIYFGESPPCPGCIRPRTILQTSFRQANMVAGAYATRRSQHSRKNGYHKGSNGFTSQERNYAAKMLDEFEETPLYAAVMTYMSYFFLIVFGYMRDFLRKYGLEKSKSVKETGNKVRQ